MSEKEEYEWGCFAVDELEGINVLEKSRGWTIAVDGTVCGLVEGDMGYDATHITIPREHIIMLVQDWPEFK